MLIESTGISEPIPIAVTFNFTTEDGDSLNDVACIDNIVAPEQLAKVRSEMRGGVPLHAVLHTGLFNLEVANTMPSGPHAVEWRG